MPFNQMTGLPVELSLHSTSSGASLAVSPVRELNSLRQRKHELKTQRLAPGINPLKGIQCDLSEIEAEIAVGYARTITFDVRGIPVVYDVASRKLSCLGSQAALEPSGGKLSLHIYVDRASVDIFGGQGGLYMPMARAILPKNQSLKLSCEGGNADIISLNVYELKSAWQ
jgi:sucrose-6-phosphate hydrolase SacC (GH32 family)